MLGSKETEDIDAFFTPGHHQSLEIYYIFQSWYELPKNNNRNNCSKIMFLPQTIKDITIVYNDFSGLHVCFSEWRNFHQEAWQKIYKFFKIDKDKVLDDLYSIKDVSGVEITAVPETTDF